MKCFFVSLSIVMSVLSQTSAFAEVTCHAGPCGNGSSCTATGDAAVCTCFTPRVPLIDYAYCRSGTPDGKYVSSDGVLPAVQVGEAGHVVLDLDPSSQVYIIQTINPAE